MKVYAPLFSLLLPLELSFSSEVIPSLREFKRERPRVLLSPHQSRFSIGVDLLRKLPRDKAFLQMLSQLKALDHAAAKALLWLITEKESYAEQALKRILKYRFPGKVDTFHCFFRLTEFGLAYDWLYNWRGFTTDRKAMVRKLVLPLARFALSATYDHLFHNYVWMSAGGLAIWAIATAGEDRDSTQIFQKIRDRFNNGLFPGWKYLRGLPSEPMGYWALYVFTPGLFTILASQSASQKDIISVIKAHGNWLEFAFENLIHSTLPNLRYIPWGDLQSGPNGGVTHEMAGAIDAATWALRSPLGAFFAKRIAEKRGLRRYWGETAMYYLIYGTQLTIPAKTPPLSFFAGSSQGGHFTARSSWEAHGIVASFRCTDHYGDHNHYDQGSFMIYREGLLAVDPPVYRRVRGPQQRTDNHNTLLFAGQGQRKVRGQWFVTLKDFLANLNSGRRLETGDILFERDSLDLAAVSGRFDQAYPENLVSLCVRQFAFLRPNKFLVVDRIRAPENRNLPEVKWLIHFPSKPKRLGKAVGSTNGRSWISCLPVSPDPCKIQVAKSDVGTFRVSISYRGKKELTLVHQLVVGKGTEIEFPTPCNVCRIGRDLLVEISKATIRFFGPPSYRVQKGPAR